MLSPKVGAKHYSRAMQFVVPPVPVGKEFQKSVTIGAFIYIVP